MLLKTSSALATTAFSAMLLSGCAKFNEVFANPEEGRMTIAGPSQLLAYGDTENFEKLDFIALLDPDLAANTREEMKIPNRIPEIIARAYEAFYMRIDKRPSLGLQNRNRIQEVIISASDQRCASYMNYIRLAQSRSQYGFGATTTLLGGLGAIFQQADVSRILSGAAGITSGISAEYQQNIFSNLASHIIVQGIENRREEIYGKILQAREQSLVAYPVEAAVRDAVRYHGACSMVIGVEAASEAIRMVKDPGLEMSLYTVEKAQKLKSMLADGNSAATDAQLSQVVQSFKPASQAGGGRSGQPQVDTIAAAVSVLGEIMISEIKSQEMLTKGLGLLPNQPPTIDDTLGSISTNFSTLLTDIKKCDRKSDADPISLSAALTAERLRLNLSPKESDAATIRENIIELEYLSRKRGLDEIQNLSKYISDRFSKSKTAIMNIKKISDDKGLETPQKQKASEIYIKEIQENLDKINTSVTSSDTIIKRVCA